MTRRNQLQATLAFLLTAFAAQAAYATSRSGFSKDPLAPRGPRFVRRLPAPAERTLGEGFLVALHKLEADVECASLFTNRDGRLRLLNTRYSPATVQEEMRVCRRGAVALTGVGSAETRLCRTFARLAPERAAVVLIHEALHYAGWSERPVDPEGLESREINAMVSDRCGL